MTLYLNTFNLRTDGSRDSFATIELESKVSPLWWMDQGLMFTATGYGKRIPTCYMVRFNGRWRRVYCCIFSNVGTCYIGKLSDNLLINDGVNHENY